MEKKMAAAAGAESTQMRATLKAIGGNEQMPVANAGAPEVVGQHERGGLKERDSIFSIRELPDYRHVDSSGFLTDVWNALKDDTKKIWRERNTIAEKP